MRRDEKREKEPALGCSCTVCVDIQEAAGRHGKKAVSRGGRGAQCAIWGAVMVVAQFAYQGSCFSFGVHLQITLTSHLVIETILWSSRL